ncbi:MAG: mercuric transporter MerT family protein [Pseudomonadales bacterium]
MMDETLDQDMPKTARQRLFVTGSLIGALLTSSCCIAPLLLVTLGISGVWVGNLTVLAPYKLYFLAITALLLAGSFWFVYFRPKKTCSATGYCDRPMVGRISQALLWVATLLVLLSATVNVWAPFFY